MIEEVNFMNYRRIKVALFNGRAFWRDSEGDLYSFDCLDDVNGKILLPRLGTNLLWQENLFDAACDMILTGKNHPWPFGFHEDDDFSVPWNRWKALTDAEKAAKYTVS